MKTILTIIFAFAMSSGALAQSVGVTEASRAQIAAGTLHLPYVLTPYGAVGLTSHDYSGAANQITISGNDVIGIATDSTLPGNVTVAGNLSTVGISSAVNLTSTGTGSDGGVNFTDELGVTHQIFADSNLGFVAGGSNYGYAGSWLTLGTFEIGDESCFLTPDLGSGNLLINGQQAAVYPLTLPTPAAYDAYAAGTVYSLTATPGAVTFGTTQPAITIATAGRYRLTARVTVKYNGSTYAGVQTLTVKLRRTNETASDIANATTTQTLAIVTTITSGVGCFEVPETSYTTTNTDDALTIFASVSATPAAGSVQVTEADIHAVPY